MGAHRVHVEKDEREDTEHRGYQHQGAHEALIDVTFTMAAVNGGLWEGDVFRGAASGGLAQLSIESIPASIRIRSASPSTAHAAIWPVSAKSSRAMTFIGGMLGQ